MKPFISASLKSRIVEALEHLSNAYESIHSDNNYTDSEYKRRADNARQAARMMASFIKDGAFVNDEAQEETIDFLRLGAKVVRSQGFPFLGLEIDALIQELEPETAPERI